MQNQEQKARGSAGFSFGLGSRLLVKEDEFLFAFLVDGLFGQGEGFGDDGLGVFA